MNLQDIINFFDSRAKNWDTVNTQNQQVIDKILDLSDIKDGVSVLDVACGTGVLFPDYQKRNAKVTGIDISPQMVKIAKEKYPQYEVICENALSFNTQKQFDRIMIFNAYPHFENPEKLIENLMKSLKIGGRFSIAHGASREEIQKCHSGDAQSISLDLPEAEEVASLLSKYLKVDIIISDSQMYMISGIKE
jgi:demethylmenaquinone methyltransferase/2-methoxy-6-polyprenyl-1,4-benzoquinol methylase